MNSKIYTKYRNILNKGSITESEIASLRSALAGWKRVALTVTERNDLRRRFAEGECSLSISQAQSTKGLLWLKNLYMSPTGKIRKSNPFNETHLEVINNYSHWTFEGLEDMTYEIQPNRFDDNKYLFPIYRIHSTSGAHFEYASHSWQTGLKTIFTSVQYTKRNPLKLVRGAK